MVNPSNNLTHPAADSGIDTLFSCGAYFSIHSIIPAPISVVGTHPAGNTISLSANIFYREREVRRRVVPGCTTAVAMPSNFKAAPHFRINMFSAALETLYASFRVGMDPASSMEPSEDEMKIIFLSFPRRISGRKERISIVLLMSSKFSSSANDFKSLSQEKSADHS